jgi:hypothetical protein
MLATIRPPQVRPDPRIGKALKRALTPETRGVDSAGGETTMNPLRRRALQLLAPSPER